MVCSSYGSDPTNSPQSRFGYGYIFCLVVGFVSSLPLPTPHPPTPHPPKNQPGDNIANRTQFNVVKGWVQIAG